MAKQCSSTTCTKESCEGCSSKQPKSMLEELNVYSEIKHVIGIVSGKGGVGKSFVTASLANQMAKKGFRVGILDADITGPSIPKMYGLQGPAQADDQGIYPMITNNDIKVMSINLLLPQEDQPVVWRGPVISGAVKQALSLLPKQINDPIPDHIRHIFDLCDLRQALNDIHFPKNKNQLEIARKRLITEELVVLLVR